MEISIELLDHLAKLARLEIPDDKKQALLKDLSDILSHAQEITKVDTSEVKELTAPGNAFSPEFPKHKDEPRHGLSAADAMEIAPDRLDDYFKVPPVIE
jgi:aspartyl-tRNA(Asn)/glutamyl-tRNA(Gln) amidotransferase subunit C